MVTPINVVWVCSRAGKGTRFAMGGQTGERAGAVWEGQRQGACVFHHELHESGSAVHHLDECFGSPDRRLVPYHEMVG